MNLFYLFLGSTYAQFEPIRLSQNWILALQQRTSPAAITKLSSTILVIIDTKGKA